MKLVKWPRVLKTFGETTSLLLTGSLLIFSGIGSFFMQNVESINYFGEKIVIDSSVAAYYYNHNTSNFLLDMGRFIEAVKHNICFPVEKIEPTRMSMKEFQKDGKFDQETYDKFLKDNNLTTKQINNYIRVKETIKMFNDCFPKTGLPSTSQQRVNSLNLKCYTLKSSEIYKKSKHIVDNYHEMYLKQFVANKAHQLTQDFFIPEKRSGTVINITFNNPHVYTMDQENFIKIHFLYNNGQKQQAEELLMDLYKDIKSIKYVDYVDVELVGNGEEFLFFSPDAYYDADTMMIPIVSKITPIEPVDFSADKLEFFQNKYKFELHQKMGIIYATEIANKINQGQMSIQELEDIAITPYTKEVKFEDPDKLLSSLKLLLDNPINEKIDEEMLSKLLPDDMYFSKESLHFLTLDREGRAIAYVNQLREPVVCILEKRETTSENKEPNSVFDEYFLNVEQKNRFFSWIKSFSNE